MGTDDKKLIISIKRATILSGIGMGLLLGIIMGLSVSETVQTIFGILTTALGAFLGFERRSYTGMEASEYQKEQHNTLFTALRVGWFGIAVVAGILSGLWMRTHEVFKLTVTQSVKQWTDAGYDSAYARKLVTYQRFAIDPNTGELGTVTEVQKSGMGILFNAEDRATLCGAIDPDNWDNNWQTAKGALLEIDKEPLSKLVEAIELNVPEGQRFDFLRALRILVCEMNMKTTRFCDLGSELGKWKNNDDTAALAAEVEKLPADKQDSMMKVLSAMVCQLEKD
ncbi:MAG: hypothetical protein HGA37_18435 [Lentimicrobium sp.]|nr:hypothetical protein [Lentimicrobium sp.]